MSVHAAAGDLEHLLMATTPSASDIMVIVPAAMPNPGTGETGYFWKSIRIYFQATFYYFTFRQNTAYPGVSLECQISTT